MMIKSPGKSAALGAVAAMLCFGLGCRPDVLAERAATKPMTMAAMRAIESAPQVVEALGAPVVRGKKWSCNISANLQDAVIAPEKGEGTSAISFDITGARGGAIVNLRATESKGNWRISNLEVALDATGKRIDLTTAVAERVFSNQRSR
jgi:hypothetical protein